MEVEVFTNDMAEDDSYEVDEDIDTSGLEGEKCGICMDIIIDRGVLDCCQHWFCFACIDNWATITNLCPLCQTEFQLITCVPVYDTIGTSKVDEDSFPRDDDWSIEGKNNTLSFPSYYIDENLSVWMVMAAKFEVDLQQLQKIPILIHQLLAIHVIYGIMRSVWDLILKALLRIHGYAQDVQSLECQENLLCLV